MNKEELLKPGKYIIDKNQPGIVLMTTGTKKGTTHKKHNTKIFYAQSVSDNTKTTEWNLEYDYWVDVTHIVKGNFKSLLLKQEEKIQYLKNALGICHVFVDEKTADLVVSLYDKILEKQGETDLKDISSIQVQIEEKYKEE